MTLFPESVFTLISGLISSAPPIFFFLLIYDLIGIQMCIRKSSMLILGTRDVTHTHTHTLESHCLVSSGFCPFYNWWRRCIANHGSFPMSFSRIMLLKHLPVSLLYLFLLFSKKKDLIQSRR